jgi:hypothetical protein
VYGLEALFNKYNVDLVITGHEHTYEMFPPIQLHKEKNRVIPHKYWYHAKRKTEIQESKGVETKGLAGETKPKATEFRKHQFMAYTVCKRT